MSLCKYYIMGNLMVETEKPTYFRNSNVKCVITKKAVQYELASEAVLLLAEKT